MHPQEHTTHRRIFSDAFRIAWSHKHLWTFGLLASMAGFGGATDAFMGSYDRPMPHMGAGYWTGMDATPFTNGLEVLLFMLVCLGFGVFLIWIASVAVGGLVTSIRAISRGGEPTIADGIDAGKKGAWSVFGVNLATRLIALTAAGLIGAAAMTLVKERTVLSAIFYLGIFIIFVAISVMASVCGAFATIDILSRKRSILQAVEDGFVVVATHWLVCLETALLLSLSLIGLLVGVALVVSMMSVPVIFLIVIFALAKATGVVYGLIAFTGLTLLGALILMMAFFGAFQTAVWTLLWHDIGEGRGRPKLARLFGHLHPAKRK